MVWRRVTLDDLEEEHRTRPSGHDVRKVLKKGVEEKGDIVKVNKRRHGETQSNGGSFLIKPEHRAQIRRRLIAAGALAADAGGGCGGGGGEQPRRRRRRGRRCGRRVGGGVSCVL